MQRQDLLCVPSRIGCVGTCVGGTAPGQQCADDTHCPGLGTCDVPACCCAPDGASECTSDAECPGSWCECP